MHKLENGSQVTTRPARKPTAGVAGYFSESNENGSPSIPGADWFNDNIDEFQNALAAAGVAYDNSKLTNLAEAFVRLTRSKSLFDVSGTANAIILTTPAGKQPVTVLNNYDEFSFIVAAKNTDAMTIAVDGLDSVSLAGVTTANQVFETALLSVRYISGSFYIKEQINPKTGNSVLDIAKLWTDTTDILRPGEYALDGSTINSNDHPIGCAIAAASSNYIDQPTKDADIQSYCGYYGFTDETDGSVTVTLPIVGGEFVRLFDDGRGVNSDQEFGGWKNFSTEAHSHLAKSYFGEDSDGSYAQNPKGYGQNLSNSNLNVGVQTGNVGSETAPRSIAYYGKTRL